MDLSEALEVFQQYNLWLLILGFGLLAVSILPRLLASYPLSMPMVILVLGFAAVKLPLGLEPPDPRKYGTIAEHLTELVVIISLMGAGLQIDRRPSWKAWSSTCRLLAITMTLTIGLCFFVGWWIAAFLSPTAMLLGAVIAPTDPVLASEVQVGSPGEGSKDGETEEKNATGAGEEDEVRFALTSEAGLNDGLAFPFTNMAIAMALAGSHPENWLGSWLLIHVLYELAVAVVIGIGLGYLLARFILWLPAKTELAKAVTGLGALAATLVIYGATECAGGYGFIATFVGAVVIRNYHRDHEYQAALHLVAEKTERILVVVVLIALGGAIAGGLLDALTWPLVISAVLILLVVRPVSGIIGMLGFKGAPWRERLAISFLGIRGVGSLYYLAYALNKESFSNVDEIWALVGLVVVASIFVHGITATLIIDKLDEMREREV